MEYFVLTNFMKIIMNAKQDHWEKFTCKTLHNPSVKRNPEQTESSKTVC